MGMMSRENIIGGLQFTAGMVTFNPLDGETITPEELNEQDKLTYDACMGSIDLLKTQEPKLVLSRRECETLPNHYERKGFCPKCNQVVEWYLNRSYCGFCGQAVKWE